MTGALSPGQLMELNSFMVISCLIAYLSERDLHSNIVNGYKDCGVVIIIDWD